MTLCKQRTKGLRDIAIRLKHAPNETDRAKADDRSRIESRVSVSITEILTPDPWTRPLEWNWNARIGHEQLIFHAIDPEGPPKEWSQPADVADLTGNEIGRAHSTADRRSG